MRLTLLAGLILVSSPRVFLQQPAAWPPPGVHSMREAGLIAPRLVRDVKPQYTADAMRAKITGAVFLEAVVEADGRVGPVRVARSLDATFGLDDQAIAALKQWMFSPAMKGGTPVPVLVTVEMTFTLADNTPAPMTLPERFGLGSGGVMSWTPHMLDDAGWRLGVQIPSDWTIDPRGATPTRLLRAERANGHTASSLEVLALKPYGGRLEDLLSLGQLRQFAKTLETGIAYTHSGAELTAEGRNTIAGRLWVWIEIVLPAADGASDGGRMWVFSATAGDRLAQIACSLTIARETTALEAAAATTSAGGVCLETLRRITIARAP